MSNESSRVYFVLEKRRFFEWNLADNIALRREELTTA